MKLTINGVQVAKFLRIDLEYITPTVTEQVGSQGDMNFISYGKTIRKWTVEYDSKSMIQAEFDVWDDYASPYVNDLFTVVITDNEGNERYNGFAFIRQVGQIDRRIGNYGATFEIIEKRTA